MLRATWSTWKLASTYTSFLTKWDKPRIGIWYFYVLPNLSLTHLKSFCGRKNACPTALTIRTCLREEKPHTSSVCISFRTTGTVLVCKPKNISTYSHNKFINCLKRTNRTEQPLIMKTVSSSNLRRFCWFSKNSRCSHWRNIWCCLCHRT